MINSKFMGSHPIFKNFFKIVKHVKSYDEGYLYINLLQKNIFIFLRSYDTIANLWFYTLFQKKFFVNTVNCCSLYASYYIK